MFQGMSSSKLMTILDGKLRSKNEEIVVQVCYSDSLIQSYSTKILGFVCHRERVDGQ